MRKDFFRTDVVRVGGVRIDRGKAVIQGFAVVTKGVTKDARGEFDDVSLETVVRLGNDAKAGIKSRFGHPTMSSTALGTFLGRVRNFRREADVVRADLHIDRTAFETPDGDLARYVMDLAESDPEMFGASMVIHWDEGKREEQDAEGHPLPPFIRVTKLLSVDVVDDPAANNGFFGTPFFTESVKPSAEITAFLDTFLNDPGAVEKTLGFLSRYRVYKEATEHNKEVSTMWDELTVETLKEKRADLFESVRKAGSEEGGRQERERVVSILKKAAAFEGMSVLALEGVEQGLTLDQAVIRFQEKRLEALGKTSTPGVGPNLEDEPGKKVSHLERAKKYQEEHGGNLTAALQATAPKREQKGV